MLNAADFPTKIWIEPTNHCNLSCPFCPYKKMKRKKGYMPFQDYQKIIDEISGHRIKELWLHNFGESTLHPDLVKMIRYAVDKGVDPILLSTNCTALNRNYAEKILRSGLTGLILSLDGASKKTYEKLRAGADYEKVVSNIKNIFLQKKELGLALPILFLQIVYSDETQIEISDYLRTWAGYLSKNDQISLKEYNDFAGQIESKAAKEKDFDLMPCGVFFENIVIFWNGDATPCCLDIEGKLNVGNVFEASIAKVWNSKQFRKYRKAVNDGEYEILEFCRKCTQGIGRPVKTFKLKRDIGAD